MSNNKLESLMKELQEQKEQSMLMKRLIKKLKKQEVDMERELKRLANPKETSVTINS